MSHTGSDIDALIAYTAIKGYAIDHKIINCIVASNYKKRFALSRDGQKIRASQGHSTTDVNINFNAPEMRDASSASPAFNGRQH